MPSQISRCWKGAQEMIESNPLLKQVCNSKSHRMMPRGVLNISTEGDCVTSVGSLFQCSIALTVKFFPMLVQNFLCSSSRPLLLVLLLCTTEKSLASSICLPPLLVSLFCLCLSTRWSGHHMGIIRALPSWTQLWRAACPARTACTMLCPSDISGGFSDFGSPTIRALLPRGAQWLPAAAPWLGLPSPAEAIPCFGVERIHPRTEHLTKMPCSFPPAEKVRKVWSDQMSCVREGSLGTVCFRRKQVIQLQMWLSQMLRALFDQAITEGHQTTHPNLFKCCSSFCFPAYPNLWLLLWSLLPRPG